MDSSSRAGRAFLISISILKEKYAFNVFKNFNNYDSHDLEPSIRKINIVWCQQFDMQDLQLGGYLAE